MQSHHHHAKSCKVMQSYVTGIRRDADWRNAEILIRISENPGGYRSSLPEYRALNRRGYQPGLLAVRHGKTISLPYPGTSKEH